MVPTLELGAGEGESKRDIQFFPRTQGWNGRGLVDDRAVGADTQQSSDDDDDYDDEETYYSASLHQRDDASIRSFEGVLDTRRDPTSPTLISAVSHHGSILAALKLQPTIVLSPTPPSTPSHYQQASRLVCHSPNTRGVDFTTRTELDLSFQRSSLIAHRIQNEEELAFNRYVDYLQEEMLRAPPPSPASDLEEEMLRAPPPSPASDMKEDDLDEEASSTNLQYQQGRSSARLDVNKSTSVLSLDATVSELSLPLNATLRLERCADQDRGPARESFNTASRTLVDSVYARPSSTWVSPDDFRDAQVGNRRIAVPAECEDGEIVENVNDAWTMTNSFEERDGAVSTSTAREEDQADVESPCDGQHVKAGKTHLGIRSKEVLKRAFRLEK